ncbi:hypothetical protein ACK8P5_16595 [Paenibacillus sp. EC2-1]|uniref:hypothetical protein n=1 Tax=Paenibacillus sp. EC2-1 TaxID=3388665 RepID=UPI003BEEBC94
MNKQLSEIAPKITNESGEEVAFAQYLSDHAGDGELFNPTIRIREILDAALNPHTPWDEVDDYLAPITRQVLSEAAEHEDRRIHLRLALAIREAWQDLNPNIQQ